MKELFENLSRRQVADYAINAAGAKDAAHPAADLGAYASRAPGIFGNHDAFDEIAIRQAEQEFARAIGCIRPSCAMGAERHKSFLQLSAKSHRQIGHFGKGLSAAGEQPAMDLPGAHRRLPAIGQPSGELLRGSVEQRAAGLPKGNEI